MPSSYPSVILTTPKFLKFGVFCFILGSFLLLIKTTPFAQAASYTFGQNSWTATSTNTAVHPANLTGWNKFLSSTNLATTTSSLTLATSTAITSARTDLTTGGTTAGNGSVYISDASIITASSTGITYVAYFSYEYSPGVINIALRSSSDNYASRIDITQSTTTGAIDPSNYVTNTKMGPAIAVGANGIIYIAYNSYEYNSTYRNIALRSSSNWSARVDVTANSSTYIRDPSIAVDSSNVVQIAYTSYEYSGSNFNIAYRNSSNWTTRTDITTSTTASYYLPNIGVDSSGVKHIVYLSREYNNYYNIAYRNSTNWANRVDVTTATSSIITSGDQIAFGVSSTGVVNVAYSSGEFYSGKTNIAYRNSTNWANRVDVTASTTAASYKPNLVVDSSGVVHMEYVSREYTSNYNNVAYRNSNNWTIRTDVTKFTSDMEITHSDASMPKIAVSPSGIISIVYPSDEYAANQLNRFSTNGNLALRTSADNYASRVDLTTMKSLSYSGAAMALDSNGVVHMAYLSFEYAYSVGNVTQNVYNIAYRNSSNWNNRVDVTTYTSNKNIRSVSIAVDSSGVVHIAYLSTESNSYLNIAYRNSTNWTNTVNITSVLDYSFGRVDDTSNQTPAIKIYGSTAYIVYASLEYNSGARNLVVRSSDNWATRTDITNYTTSKGLCTDNLGRSSSVGMAIDSSGVIYIAYLSNEYNSSYKNIAYRNSNNWVTRTDITTYAIDNSLRGAETGTNAVGVSVDSLGIVHILYLSQEYNPSIYNVVYRNSNNWTNRVDLSTSTVISVLNANFTVEQSGMVHVGYQSPDSYPGLIYKNSLNWANKIYVMTATQYYYVNSNFGFPILVSIDSSRKVNFIYSSTEYSSGSASSGNTYNLAYRSYIPAGYNITGSLQSSNYNTNNAANALKSISWDEGSTLPTGTNVTLSLRTGSSTSALASAIYTNFTNATSGCTKAFGIVTCSSSAIPSAMQNGTGNQWFQYQVTLNSNGLNTPSTTAVSVVYVVNDPPQFDSSFGTNGVKAIQVATSTDPSLGKVFIQYRVLDDDTNTGNTTPGFITPSFEYNTGSGWNPLTSGFLGTGDLNNKAVSTSTYATHSATWDALGQTGGVYSSSTQIRVTANDNELLNNSAQATGSIFILDAKAPTASVALDIPGGTIAYNLSDNNNLQYRISNNADGTADGLNALSNNWTNPNSTSTSATSTWSFINANSNATVYILGKDYFGNTSVTMAVAPAYPGKFSVADLSSPGTGQYREIASWQTYNPVAGAAFAQYKIYRSLDNVNFTPLTTVSNINTSYYIDSAVTFGTVYYYKMQVIDTDGDASAFTNISSIEAGVVNDKIPPVISNVNAVASSTTASVFWTTNKFSTSQVAYGLSANYSAYSLIDSTLATTSVSQIINLAPNTLYHFQAIAKDSAGNLATSSDFTFTTAVAADSQVPTVPTVLTASSSSPTAIYLSWVPSNDNVGVTGYHIWRNGSLAGTTTLATFTDMGLTASTTYAYTVSAFDAAGNESAQSASATVTTLAAADIIPPAISNVASSTSATTATITWKTNKPSDSQIIYGLSANYSAASIKNYSLATSSSASLSGLLPNTLYHFQVIATDGSGNVATSSDLTILTTTAVDTQAPTVPGGLEASTKSASEIDLTWVPSNDNVGVAGYNIFRDGVNIASTSLAVYSDTGLTASTTYAYAVSAFDAAGNASELSVTASANTLFGQDKIPPVISNISVSETLTTSAKISWITDKPADSVVDYALSPGLEFGQSSSSSELTASHVITLDGLLPGTTYLYRVKSTDSFGNLMVDDNNGRGYSLTTLSGPVISEVLSSAKESEATVTWVTDRSSDSYVYYSTSPDLVPFSVVGNGELLGAPSPSSSSGASSTPEEIFPQEATSTPPSDSDLPLDNGSSTPSSDSGVSAQAQASTTELFAFDTSPDASSTPPSDNDASSTPPSIQASTEVIFHSVTIPGLLPNTTYYFYVKSTDASHNPTIGKNNAAYYSFTTSGDVTGPVFSKISAPIRTSNTAVIVWTTDELSTSQVQYGTASGTLTNVSDLDDTLTISHVVIISGLKTLTPYFYTVKSQDKTGNQSVSEENTLITAAEKETIIVTVEKVVNSPSIPSPVVPPVPIDTTPPVLSAISSDAVSAFDANINFNSGEPAIGIVEYGQDVNYGNSNAADGYTTRHSIKLSGLRMGTEYHFRVKALDKSGNEAVGEDQTFTTTFLTNDLSKVNIDNLYQYQQEIENQIESILPSVIPPFIGKVQVSDITQNSATINWPTNLKSYAVVDYSTDGEFTNAASGTPYSSQISNTSDKITDHKIVLSNLLPNTKYHFRVEAFTLPKAVGFSTDAVFVTKAGDLEANITGVTLHAFRVVWSTTDPTDDIVEYKNAKTGEIVRKVDDSLKKFHDVTIENLPSDTKYFVSASSISSNGNVLKTKVPVAVSTIKDIVPPEISNLKITNTLIPGSADQVQTLVSWVTDKPATSVVYYEEGVGAVNSTGTLSNQTKTNGDYITNHVVVLSTLKAGSIYRIQIQTTDSAGNMSQSAVKTIVVPKQSQSVSDLIFKNFEDSFKFLQNSP